MNIIQALDDKLLLGSAIRKPETWRAWRVLLKAFFGLRLSEVELATYRECTGRSDVSSVTSVALW